MTEPLADPVINDLRTHCALAGIAVVLPCESMDRVFQTVRQVRDEIAVDILGFLPMLARASLSEPTKQKSVTGNMPLILRYSNDHPFSAYAETLRSATAAADLALKDRSPKILGMVSLFPGEGKSTVAKNFASLLALKGARS